MERHNKKLGMVLHRWKAGAIDLLLLFLASFSGQLHAQVFPAEGSKLHYRLVKFSAPQVGPGASYTFEIASGHYASEDSFKQNTIISRASSRNKTLAEVPSFGAQYTWRTTAHNPSGDTKSELHHFSTGIIPNVDTNVSRLRILNNNDRYKDAYVFVDGKRTLYDMKGHPVWYLPGLPGFSKEKMRDLRDLKLSPKGTITFLLDQQAYEINYDGDILWKGPNTGVVSGKRVEHYHHEFTRLANGHYMVLGDEHVLWKLPPTKDSAVLNNDKVVWDKTNKTLSQKLDFGTLIEYDEKGKVVWSWKSSGYFKTSDLINRKTASGMYDIDVHENSFFFNEKAKVIYLSFRNISRVIKIRYPDGKVIGIYGNIYKQGTQLNEDGLFCYQHSCRRSKKGYLYLYDNNSCNPGTNPKILMMKEPGTDKEKIKTVWEYECNNEVKSGKKQTEDKYTTGGNVIELPDSSLFVSMCSGYSELFIVGLDKKTFWSAIPEKWNADEKMWEGTTQYRSSIINTRKELEDLILNSGRK
jgi:hypothetical protein